MGKSTDSMVVLNQRDYCLAAELMVVPVLQSGPSPSFLHSAVFQYLSHGNLSSVIHESTLKGAALKGPPLDLKRCKAVKVKSKTPGKINLRAYN